MRISALTATVALAALLLLSGCGSSTATKTVTVSPQSASTSAGTTTSASSNPTTSTTSNSTAPPGVPLCRAGTLSLAFLGQQGATGHGVLGFELRNIGSSSCHTFGYPGILWLDKGSSPLPTDSVRTTRDFFGSAPLASITVPPGGVVSFRLGVTHITAGGGNAGCTTAAGVQVIPPNDTSTLRLTIPNGAYECRTTTISPVRPGKSAFQF